MTFVGVGVGVGVDVGCKHIHHSGSQDACIPFIRVTFQLFCFFIHLSLS